MSSFNRLDVQVKSLLGRVLADGSVARVGERTCLTIAKASDIVLVSAEVVSLVGSVDLVSMSTYFNAHLPDQHPAEAIRTLT